MHKNGVRKQIGFYRWNAVDLVLSNIALGKPITIFSPSGGGKSSLMNYLAFNHRYKFFHPIKSYNTHFIYFDTKYLKTEKIDQRNVIYSGDKTEIARIYKQMLYPYLLDVFKHMAEEYHLKNIDEEDFIKYIDKLIKLYPRKRFFIFIDGVDQIFDAKYEVVRSILKFLRDKYRGHIEFIFTMTHEKYLDSKVFSEIGEIGNLIGQRILYLPINLSTYGLSILSSVIPMNLYTILYVFRFRLRKSHSQIDYLSGGYGPYSKAMLSMDENELNDILKYPLSLELRSRTERLLRSFNPSTNQILLKIAGGVNPDNLDHNAIKNLTRLGILKEGKLFSPVLEKYLHEVIDRRRNSLNRE